MHRAIVALLVAVAALHAAHAKEITTDGPRIECEDRTHDFGTITQHATVEHVFKFRNTGNATLKISRVQASCGCTAALLSAKEIAAGEPGEVELTFKSQDFKGKVRKYITLYTNDPVNKNVRLNMSAEVLSDMVCTPTHLSFGRIDSDNVPVLAIKLLSPIGKEFSIKSVRPSLQFIKTEIVEPEKDDAGGERIVNVTIDGMPPPGQFRGTIEINIDLNEKTRMTVSVSGFVRARTEVIPPKLFFGVVGAGETPKREIIIRATSWKGLKVEKVEAPDGLAVTTEEVTEGKEWRVSVQLNGPFGARMVKDKIKVYLNDEKMKEIEVKVYALISKKDK